ncbi:MAG TPA: hypothetical protein VN914_04740 [Polyangia bacterium]|nr:hypothetical protein [Polyangia bacterium]
MVSPRIVPASLALLLGCQASPVPAPAPAPFADAAPPADVAPPERFGAGTSWQPCGMLGKVESLLSLASSPDGHYLAAGSDQVSIWDLRSGTFVRTIGTDGGLKYGFSFDGELVALTGDARTVARVADGQEVFVVSERGPTCIDWSSAGTISPDKRTLALGSCGTVELHALDGRGVGRLASHVFAPGVAYSPDGRWLGTSGPELYTADGDRRLWPAEVVPAPRPADPYYCGVEDLQDNSVAFSPDSSLMLVSNTIIKPTDFRKPWEARTQLVRVADGSLLQDFGTSLPRHPSFSPDGAWIVAGGELVYLRTRTFTPLDTEVEVSAFLPDGRIAAAGKDHAVRLYCPR